jgi:peroxiredoxin/glutaredoxin
MGRVASIARHPRVLSVGDQLPDATFTVRSQAGGSAVRTTAELFGGARIVLFGLPGAFTPTCATAHVPRFQELAPEFRRQGVSAIYCVSVNDPYVMAAWQAAEQAPAITFLPDTTAAFTKAVGLLADKTAEGLGLRSRRYALVAEDGVVERLFVEPDEPGDPYTVSDADHVLLAIGGRIPPDILLFTNAHCAHCHRARVLLSSAGLAYEERPASPRTLRALPGARTTPQVFVDGVHLGGADALAAWLADRPAA